MALVKPPLGARLDGRSQLARGLVGCWLFNEGGGIKAFDISGRGNHGTLTNMANPSTSASGRVATRFGKGLAFDGSNDTVVIPQSAGSGGITYSVLAMPNSFAIAYTSVLSFFSGADTSTQFFQILVKSTGKLALYVNTGVGNPTKRSYDGTGAYTLTAGKWCHLVLTCDGNNLCGYVDGRLDKRVATADSIAAFPGASLIVGNDPVYGPRFFAGQIDNVRVYNRALSMPEVGELYRNPYVGISMPTRKRIYSSTGAATNYGRGFFGFM